MNQISNDSPRLRHLELNLIDTLEMYKNIAILVRTCTQKDPLIAHTLQLNSAILEKVLELLFIQTSDLSKYTVNVYSGISLQRQTLIFVYV